MKKFTTYVIVCSENRYYIGSTDDVERRMFEHNSGMSWWTKKYHDWKLIYKKEFDDLGSARKWEIHLKKQKGGNGFKKEIGLL